METRRESTSLFGEQRLVVLVVEDDPSIAGLVTEVLELAGYRVSLAPDGRAALSLASRERPALVLTDRMMPEIGGVDLVRRLRANKVTRKIPVVLMSSTRPSVTRTPAERGRADTLASTQWMEIDGEMVPFVPKPFDLDELVGLVDALAHEPGTSRSAEPVGAH